MVGANVRIKNMNSVLSNLISNSVNDIAQLVTTPFFFSFYREEI